MKHFTQNYISLYPKKLQKAFRKWFLKNYFLNFFVFIFQKLVNKKYFSINRKYFPVKEKYDLISKKVFSFYFGRKTLSKNYEKFKIIILFADYIKFGPQIFYCYIYFVLNIYFSISSLKI